jgi:hypothetical protein
MTLSDIMTPHLAEILLDNYCYDEPSTPENLMTSDAPVHSWENNQSIHIMDDLYIQQDVLDAILYGDYMRAPIPRITRQHRRLVEEQRLGQLTPQILALESSGQTPYTSNECAALWHEARRVQYLIKNLR